MAYYSDNTSQSFSEEDVKPKISKSTKKRPPRKVGGEWPDEKVSMLIAIVKQRKTLWDLNSSSHKESKDQIWQEVSAKIGEDDWNNCRNKWQSLRVTFKTNLAKLNRTKSGGETSDHTKKIRWKFFDAMRFIAFPDDVDSTGSMTNLNLTQDSSRINEGYTTPVSELKRKRTDSVVDPLIISEVQSLKPVTEKRPQLMNRFDEHAAFGNHIAAELRRLSSKDSLRLKRRLTRVLLDFWEEQDVNDSRY